MQELKKHAALLVIIGLLSILKFVIVPIFDWQNDALLNIGLLEKKQNKIERLISNQKQAVGDDVKLSEIVNKSEAVFFVQHNESTFKLQQQKKIEDLLSKHNITASNFGWQATKEYVKISAKSYQLLINFSGQSYDVLALMLALETNPKLIGISDFNLRIKGQSKESMGMITGRFTLQLYAMNEGVK